MQLGRFHGKPAAVICVYQAPGSNALATADALKTQMAEMAARFPADVAYDVALDTTLPVSEGINEIVHTLRRGDGARHHRRLRLPPGLARDADPADRGAGLAGRRVRLLPHARLLDQHALAARAGARDRPRRRRRDRGRRGGRGGDRARPLAARRDDQGDGRGLRARDRHRADPRGRLRSGRLHDRDHGQPLPAVRDHHRDLGADLGLQRAHALAGALGAPAAAASSPPTGPLGRFFAAFNRGFERRRSGYVGRLGPPPSSARSAA